jgi:hypothetical protein
MRIGRKRSPWFADLSSAFGIVPGVGLAAGEIELASKAAPVANALLPRHVERWLYDAPALAMEVAR